MTAVEWLMQMLEQNNIIDLDLVDSFGYYALIEQAKQMEAEQRKSDLRDFQNIFWQYLDASIPEISDEEIENEAYRYDENQAVSDWRNASTYGDFIEGAKWYREQLKQRQWQI